ncbi:MAG TPA: VPLPA-CTERM-specific exosortase XrtD [Azospirillaceae bacterium]|nr:VPLPA-CTERM-specific exosortase XrtD [Azospirillaceae bacterium]
MADSASLSATPSGFLRRHGLLIYSLVAVVVVAFAFRHAIAAMADSWRYDEYSHGWLIPILSALLLLHRVTPPGTGRGSPGGIVLAGGGMMLLALGELSAVYTLSQIGLILTIAALVWAAAGTRNMPALIGPLVYLGFAVPLPHFFQAGLSLEMQLMSSRLGVTIMRALDVSVYLEGNVIDLGIYKLEVAEACNGLRYLFPLTGFSFLAALLLKDAWWKRAVLFLSAIPIAISMNALRIAVIGILVDRHGIAMAEGALHFFEGWLVFVVCIAILLVEIQLLMRCGRRGRLVPVGDMVPQPAQLLSLARRPAPSSFKAAVLLIVAAGAGVALLDARPEKTPGHAPLADFPLHIAPWTGKAEALAPQTLEVLKPTDYAMINYSTPEPGAFINLHVAYYASQRAGASAHSPQACIPAGGWLIDDIRQLAPQAPAEDFMAFPVNRVLIRRGDARQLIYYWFEQRGRAITNEYLVKVYILWDALTRQRTDGALVRLAIPIPPGEEETAADGRLAEFLKAVYPHLARHLPR